MVNSLSKSIQAIIVAVVGGVATAWGLNLIGIESNGTKIKDPTSENGQIQKLEELNKKELELKERELKLKIIEIEKKYETAKNQSESYYNLSGNWVTANGVSYSISQSNNTITINEYSIFFYQQYLSFTGFGVIKDNQINGSGYGLLGQMANFSIEIIDEKILKFNAYDTNGYPISIILNKSE